MKSASFDLFGDESRWTSRVRCSIFVPVLTYSVSFLPESIRQWNLFN